MNLLILTQKVDRNDDVLGFFHGWIREFAKYYESVTVIALGVGEYELPKNIRVFSLGKERGVSRLEYALNFYRFIWRERKNYDDVFVHMNPVYAVLGGFFWRVCGKKVALWYTHKHADIKLRLALRFANIIFTASRESFRLSSKRVLIVGHGIDVEKFKPMEKQNDGAVHIVTAGRISPVKDYETLLRAAEILAQKKFSFDVKIIGGIAMESEREYLARLKELVQDKKIKAVVSFVGPVSNRELPEYLGKADIFVNMSQTGSLDKAVLEAMACGIPVITSNEAFKEVLGPYSKMFMFSKCDAEDLARKIREVGTLDIREKQEMVKRFRDIIVNEHNLEVLMDKIYRAMRSSDQLK